MRDVAAYRTGQLFVDVSGEVEGLDAGVDPGVLRAQVWCRQAGKDRGVSTARARAADPFDENYDPLRDYAVWFANR